MDFVFGIDTDEESQGAGFASFPGRF